MKSAVKTVCCLGLIIFGSLAVSATVHAQQPDQTETTTVKAQVIKVIDQKIETVPGTSVQDNYQDLQVKIIDGDETGKVLTVENDYVTLKAGDIFFLTHTIDPVNGDTYVVSDPYRLPWLYGLVGLFILCVLIFGGKQGFRGLIALALGFLVIGYVLFPSILHGYSPVLVSIGVAGLIVILGSYITHGFNKITTSAVIGMVVTIIFTGALAYVSIHGAKLTGLGTDEAVSLNMDTNGTIDFAGLLLGGILIGLLGVLYDAAIGQAVAVDELHHVGPHLPRIAIFRRALRIGREHIGALVNVLAIAYVGASLPLLLLFYESGANFALTINKELFATEIVRAMVGSIGLILAVPITTAIAVLMLIEKATHDHKDSAIITSELKKIEEVEHKH